MALILNRRLLIVAIIAVLMYLTLRLTGAAMWVYIMFGLILGVATSWARGRL